MRSSANDAKMIDIDECRLQGDLFELSLEVCNCSSPIFIRRFMNSKIAALMDSGDQYAKQFDLLGKLEQIDEEYGVSNYGSVKYFANEMHWIGMLLRYLNLYTGISSKNLYKSVNAEVMRTFYPAFHTQDIRKAADAIIECQSISVVPASKDELTEHGVRILKGLREKSEDGAYMYSLECFSS